MIAPLLFAAPPRELHVEGNRLMMEGQPVVLRGVNVPSLEWSNEGEKVYRSIRVAMEDWGANAIRLPVSQDRWFAKAEGQKKPDEYRYQVWDAINFVTNRKGFVILDLHWSDEGEWGENIGQHFMPDAHSVEFWRDVAKHFRGNPRVLFSLYNEPHDVSWNVWKSGGPVEEKEEKYDAVGMQTLVDAVRKERAKNVLVVGGLDWAYDLTGVKNGFALQDPNGRGIVYDAHLYPWKKDWDRYVGATAETFPVLIGEVGCEPDPKQEKPETWAPRALDWIEKRNLSWTAWSFHPSAKPCLIENWQYKPTPYWGRYVKERLTKPVAAP